MLEKSDRVIAVVKDLFGDDPKVYAEMYHVRVHVCICKYAFMYACTYMSDRVLHVILYLVWCAGKSMYVEQCCLVCLVEYCC